MRKHKKIITAFTITSSVVILLLIIKYLRCKATDYYTLVYRNPTQEELNNKNRTKYALFWTEFFGASWLEEFTNKETADYKYFELKKCPISNCVLTSNRNFLENITDFDAIIYHGSEHKSPKPVAPEFRSSHQKYIMATIEPPSTFYHDLKFYNGFFNWSMTYKLNSEILWNYGTFRDKVSETIIIPRDEPIWRAVEVFNDEYLLNIIKKKTKMAAQFVSHCNAVSKRDDLVKALQKYISVDVYGKCGPLKCPQTKENNDYCNEMLDDEYKFYFAFENELCEDYVTEKLFNAMHRYIIPVVYGGANYNRWTPPKSYINANSFSTAEELANYLIYLSNNPKEYLQYFWWRKYYEPTGIDLLCNICMKLHDPIAFDRTEIYKDIKSFLWEDCQEKPRILFK